MESGRNTSSAKSPRPSEGFPFSRPTKGDANIPAVQQCTRAAGRKTGFYTASVSETRFGSDAAPSPKRAARLGESSKPQRRPSAPNVARSLDSTNPAPAADPFATKKSPYKRTVPEVVENNASAQRQERPKATGEHRGHRPRKTSPYKRTVPEVVENKRRVIRREPPKRGAAPPDAPRPAKPTRSRAAMSQPGSPATGDARRHQDSPANPPAADMEWFPLGFVPGRTCEGPRPLDL